MKSKFLKITMIVVLIMSLLQVSVRAELGEMTVTALTNKDTYGVGEIVEVTVDWEKGAEAVGFTLKYDSDKLQFDSSSMGDNFYDATTTAGEISFNWASFDGSTLTKATFNLKTKAEGKAMIEPVAREFADGNLVAATGYTNVSKEITIGVAEEKPGEGEEPGQNPGQQPEQKPDETPEKVTLESISITKTPTRNTYRAGEKFETTGMEITAKYSDSTSKVVKNYTYSPSGVLKANDSKVVISYTENGVTKTVEQKITIIDGAGQGSGETENKTPTGDKQDNTTAPEVIPNAGQDATIIISIVAFAIIAIIGFKKYRSLADVR